MTPEIDRLRSTEQAVHAVMNALYDKMDEVLESESVPAQVFHKCISHIKSLYTQLRYRTIARMDEVLCVNEKTGLPASVEISKVYQDTQITDGTRCAQLTYEKGLIVEHILEKGTVPEAFVDKTLRTAYLRHASTIDLSEIFFFAKSAERTSEERSSYWCSWFNHVAEGSITLYLMRYETDPDTDIDEYINQIIKETRNGNMTAPGVFGARIDEAINEVYPKEIHAYFVKSLTLGEDLADIEGSVWKPDEFLVNAHYEKALSQSEKLMPQGFFTADKLRQVWVTNGDPELKDRLSHRRKRMVLAPHSVLQRMSGEIVERSLEPIVTNLN